MFQPRSIQSSLSLKDKLSLEKISKREQPEDQSDLDEEGDSEKTLRLRA